MRRATTPCRIRSMMRTIPLLSSGFDLLNDQMASIVLAVSVANTLLTALNNSL
ncbi:hypothetical protein KSS87_017101, partial [Heliosperma pusillum]